MKLLRFLRSASTDIAVSPVGKRMPPLPSVSDILKMYGIKAKKSLSQNFIMDPRILNKISEHADVQGKYVVEVGPGPGGITRSLLKYGAKHVTVIEKDSRFIPPLDLLKEAVGNDKFRIEIGDCLMFQAEKMFPESVAIPWDSVEPTNVVVVGNLPFNVATPFFVKLMVDMDGQVNYYKFGRVPAILTFQHEVAMRMAAPPEDPERCRLSVMSQNYMEVDYLFKLPGGAFVPAPQVDVGVVKITPHIEKYIDFPFGFVNKVVTGLFHRKRAKYLNSVSQNLFPKNVRVEATKMMSEILNIPEKKSPVQLTMEEISSICHAYDQVIRILDERDVKSNMKSFVGYREVQRRAEERKRLEYKEQKLEETEGSRLFDFSSFK